jgi:hypothetical protein
MDRPERPSRDKVQVTPEASRPDLFQFLEKLFDGADQKPERIELRQAYGDGARKYGTVVIQKEYKANSAKPPREQIVSLSNELLDLAQRNCNELRKPYRYAILAKHYAKSDDYYGCFLLSMRPKQPAMEGDDVSSHGLDDEEATPDAKRRDEFIAHSLAHIKQSDENDRWRQDQHATSTGDIIEKYQNLVQMLMSQNLEMQREHRELFKTADEALSKKSERDLAAKMQDFKMGIMSDGFKFIQQMAPVVVNQLKGKTPGVGESSAESIAVTSFLQGLTEKQAGALFGDDASGTWTENGIFTHAQAKIFSAVAQCQVAPSELDKLLDGEHAVTETQIMKAQTIVASQQFMPLVALVLGRRQKKLEASSPQSAAQP